jgi:histidinol-phosphate/aromatic aminotransferase/cobyric acid decarboxylase-like protein
LAEIWAAPPAGKRDYREVLNLASNEVSHPGHRRLVETWLRTVRGETIAQYPYYPETRARLATRLACPLSDVLLVAGADEGARILAFALGRAYGRVVLGWPNYQGYVRYCELAGVSLSLVDPTDGPGGLRGEPALAVVADPDPVTGDVLSCVKRLAWCDAAACGGHLLVADGAYIGFAPDDIFAPSWAPASLRTFSKSLGMAGLRLAALIAPPELTDYLSRWAPTNAVSSLALSFLGFALDREAEFAAVRADIARVREAIATRIRNELPWWRVVPSKANFLALRLPTAREAADIAARLAMQRIVVRTFSPGEGDSRMLRMTVIDESRMNDVLDRLIAIARGLGCA